jgi:hypothetical protein
LLAGCAAQRASYVVQRDAPELTFKGPARSVALSAAQIAQVQKGIAQNLKGNVSPNFGKSYRAALTPEKETVVCGYVDGKRFVGMFAKPQGGTTQFLPIGISLDQQEEDAVKLYCRGDGIYLPH